MRDRLWAPEPNSRVRVESRDDEVSPPGVWRVLAHGPTAPTAWWIYPHDDEAREWVAANKRLTVSSCLEVLGNRLTPPTAQIAMESK